MESVGVRELRQNLSVYLRRIKAGERLQVTEHGQPIAVISPPSKSESVLERLIAEGRATRPTESWATFVPPTGEVSTRLSDAIEELRADRL